MEINIKKLFRKSIFGGFNKKDVEEYIEKLEEELEKAKEKTAAANGLTDEDKSIIDESINEITKLKNEKDSLTSQINELNRKLEEQSQNASGTATDAENPELIMRLLAENKHLKEEIQKNEVFTSQQEKDREVIKKVLGDAKEQARTLLVNAEKEAEERRRRAEEELKNELEDRVLDFVTNNYRMAEFVNEIDSICEQLRGISDSMKKLPKEVPTRVIDLLDESERRIVEPAKEVGTVPDDPEDEQERKHTAGKPDIL